MPRIIETPYRPDKLRSVIERLDRLSGRLAAVENWMEEEGLEQLGITNHGSMVQGLDYLEKFGQAAERARDNHRLGVVHRRGKSD